MKLNRRNVLAGLGTAAAGTAAVFGTGAFVEEQVSRDFTVSITNDNGNGVQLPITPNSNLNTNSRVSVTSDNGVDKLVVDATNLPTGSNVTIGNFSNVDDSGTMSGGAFTVENQNAFGSDIELTISLASTSGNSTVELAVDDGSVTTVTEGGSYTTSTLATGETVDVGVWISTAGSAESETIDVTIQATEVSA